MIEQTEVKQRVIPSVGTVAAESASRIGTGAQTLVGFKLAHCSQLETCPSPSDLSLKLPTITRSFLSVEDIPYVLNNTTEKDKRLYRSNKGAITSGEIIAKLSHEEKEKFGRKIF